MKRLLLRLLCRCGIHDMRFKANRQTSPTLYWGVCRWCAHYEQRTVPPRVYEEYEPTPVDEHAIWLRL